ncbi:hypothetical protein BGZ46_005765 [Entomortierella lignicola]|nr:hypothetical protein BGZ46_005765 [Entomortierella lignicola]
MKNDAPTIGLRLTRFLNPWHKESQSSEPPPPLPPMLETDETIVEEIEEIDTVEVKEQGDTTEVIISTETHTVVEHSDESGASNSMSQAISTSQETISISDASVADPNEDFQETKLNLEREESVVSGQESDSTVDPRESRRSKRKARSPAPTPSRPTRRSTRSLAAKTEENTNREESATPDPESTTTTINPISEPQTADDLPETSKSKSGKKKKKGKQAKQGAVEEIEKETLEQSERIAEQIRKSEEIIKESESLGRELNTLENTTDAALDQAQSLLAPDNEDVKSPFADSEEVHSAEIDEDDQTFHSTTQFDTFSTVNNDEDRDGSQLYPTIEEDALYYEPEEENDESESADTVKYYPPESPAAESQESDVVQTEQEHHQKNENAIVDVEMIELQYDSEDKSPSPPAAAFVPESYLMDSDEFEFSPMQSRSPSPKPVEPTSPQSEYYEDCPTIAKIEPINCNEFGMHPVHNIDFLEAFFRRQKGHLLTPMQADYCCQLIMDSVIPSSNTKWISGEDGVSFRNPASKDPKSFLVSTQDKTLASTEAPKAPVLVETPKVSISAGELETPASVEAPKVLTSNPATMRLAPFTVIRQPVSTKNEPPKLPPLPPLDEYLEIEKYKGVEWDDLPSHVRVKRYLEWKGTESPEVVKKRRMEERERMRKENAKFWAQKEKAEAEELASVEAGARLKRKVSVSEPLSDSENESSGRKRGTLTSPAKVTGVTTDVTTDVTPNAPRAQTVAEKILAIVRQDKEEKKTESKSPSSSLPSTEPSKPLFTQPAPNVPTINFGATPKTSTETSNSIFGSNVTKDPPKSLFGSTPVTSSSTPPSTVPTFAFGAPKTDTVPNANTTLKTDTPVSAKPAFNFGIPKTDTAPKTDTPVLAKPTFNFGIPSSLPLAPTTTTTTASTFAPTSSFGASGFSFSVPTAAAAATAVSAFGGNKNPISFGGSNQNTSSNPFAALLAKSSSSGSSLQNKDKAKENEKEEEEEEQESVIVLSDGEEDEGSYTNDNEAEWSGGDDEEGSFGESGGEDALADGDEDEEGYEDENSEDHEVKHVFSSPQFASGQSTTNRRPSGTDLFERRESSSSSGQPPRTPEFTFEFGPPKISTVARPISPSPGSKGSSLFGVSPFGQTPTSSTTASVSTPSFGTFGGTSWGGSSAAPVFTFNSNNSRRSEFDDDDDFDEEEPHFDKYEEEEDGTVSPFMSPIISPRQSPQ